MANIKHTDFSEMDEMVAVYMINSEPYIMLIEKGGDEAVNKVISFPISPFRIDDLTRAIENTRLSRPMTFDLMKSIIDIVPTTIFDKADIHSIENGEYRSTIHLNKGGKLIKVEAKPEDAFILAKQYNCPFVVAKNLLIMPGEFIEWIKKKSSDLESIIADMKPDDFFKA